MIKSMTGFASLTHEDERATIGVTVRAVNHRFLDLQLRIPQSLGGTRAARPGAAAEAAGARPRRAAAISVQLRSAAAPTVELNEEFVEALPRPSIGRASAGLVTGALTPGDLLRLPQAITIRDRPAEPDPTARSAAAASVEAAVEQALADLDAMRVREGEHLRADLDGAQGVARRLDRAAARRGRPGTAGARSAAAASASARSAASCRSIRR